MADRQRPDHPVSGMPRIGMRARELLPTQAKLKRRQRPGSDVIRERLRLGAGFSDAEHNDVVVRLGALGSRLRSFQHGAIDLELSIKDRGASGQRVTLICRLGGLDQLVATSDADTVTTALHDVREQMIRQVDDAKTRREPRNNRVLRRRSLRSAVRHGEQDTEGGRIAPIAAEREQ